MWAHCSIRAVRLLSHTLSASEGPQRATRVQGHAGIKGNASELYTHVRTHTHTHTHTHPSPPPSLLQGLPGTQGPRGKTGKIVSVLKSLEKNYNSMHGAASS